MGGSGLPSLALAEPDYPVLEKLVFGQYIEENTCF